MKTLFLTSFLCVVTFGLLAQTEPTTTLNGTYHLLKPEKGPNGPTQKMLVELAEQNNTKMLAIAGCERCYPSVYTYKPELSKQFGKPVFYNSSGIHVITYDDESFIICMAAISIEKDFNYINFYSKNKVKVQAMNQTKMESYASKILEYL